MATVLKQLNKLQDMLLTAIVDFTGFDKRLVATQQNIQAIVNYINDREHLNTHNLHLIVQALKANNIEVQLQVPVVNREAQNVQENATPANPPTETTEANSCDQAHAEGRL